MQPSQKNGCNIQVSQFQNHSWMIYFHFHIYNIVYILTLECNFFVCFLMLSFEAQQRRLLLQMEFDLRLNTVNYLFITM